MTATLQNVYDEVKSLESQLAAATLSQRVVPSQIVTWSGLSDINNSLGLVVAGEFRSGNGIDPGNGFSGVRINIDGVSGYNNDVLQSQMSATDGKLYGLYGEIGGWTLNANEIKDTTGMVGLSSVVTAGDDIRIWAGDTDKAVAPLQITESGDIYAENIYIGESSTDGIATIQFSHGGYYTSLNSISSIANAGATQILLDANNLTGSPGVTEAMVSMRAVKLENALFYTNQINIVSDFETGISTIEGYTAINSERGKNDTYIYGDSDTTPVVAVDSINKRVGIGTITPGAKFDVVGTVQASDTMTLLKGLVVNEDSNDADTRIEGNGDANLVFVDASADAVGIGVSDPDAKLEVAGTLHIQGTSTFDDTVSATNINLGDAGAVIGGVQTISNNTVYIITPSNTNGIIEVCILADATAYGKIGFNTVTPSVAGYILNSSVVTGTGALTDGTTDGTDLKLNVNVHTDGKVYIKNRMGSSKNVRWSFSSHV